MKYTWFRLSFVMAKPSPKSKTTTTTARVIEESKKHKGVHAKSGTSLLKSSKNYKKKYRGQGRWLNLKELTYVCGVSTTVLFRGWYSRTILLRWEYLSFFILAYSKRSSKLSCSTGSTPFLQDSIISQWRISESYFINLAMRVGTIFLWCFA